MGTSVEEAGKGALGKAPAYYLSRIKIVRNGSEEGRSHRLRPLRRMCFALLSVFHWGWGAFFFL